jgi:glucose/arabinose dehydrogenase
MMHKYFSIICLFIFGCSLFHRNENPTHTSRSVSEVKKTVDGSGYLFDPNDTSCDGYPQLKVQSLKGTCVGLVVSQTNTPTEAGKKVLKMPRTIVSIPDTDDFLVVDMGGWAPAAGMLFLLKQTAPNKHKLIKIKDKLKLPHGLEYNPNDGYFYIGEDLKVSRFHFSGEGVSDWETVVDGLPDVEKHMHPLTQIVFNPVNNDLYINSGAPSDHCMQKNKDYSQPCKEAKDKLGMAQILRVRGELLKNIPKGGIKPDALDHVAFGLRNSMAMAIHDRGVYLVQGENSRDFPELEEPYEEMNVIGTADKFHGFHHGWPYCYNYYATSPEWAFKENSGSLLKNALPEPLFKCDTTDGKNSNLYKRPHTLIPPHAAPLHAGYYKGEMFADMFKNTLLMSWHGYRPTGQRFVGYQVNDQGYPIISKDTSKLVFNVNQPNGCAKPMKYEPRGKTRPRFVPYTEIISGWAPLKNIRPKGAPTGFTIARDGSIWIVEDKNKTIVRIAKSSTANHQDNCGSSSPPDTVDPTIPLLAWRNYLVENPQSQNQYLSIKNSLLTENYCMGCHDNFHIKEVEESPGKYTFMDYLVRNEWLVPQKPDDSNLYAAISQNGKVPAMPPNGKDNLKGTPEGDKIIANVAQWIKALPTNIETRVKRVTINGNLNIRNKPTTSGEACGQFKADDIAYIDPRPESKIQAGGIRWSKVYVVPNSTRLYEDKCAYPEDGVFYSAVKD